MNKIQKLEALIREFKRLKEDMPSDVMFNGVPYKLFQKVEYHSHNRNHTEFDTVDGYISNGDYLTYKIGVIGHNANREFLEAFLDNKKSTYAANDIPSKFKSLWGYLKKEYINRYKGK